MQSRMQSARDAEKKHLFTVGYYNVGMQQSMLDNRKEGKAQMRVHRLAQDIADAFKGSRLDLLGLCELGGHADGLNGGVHFGTQAQVGLMQHIVRKANYLYRVRQGCDDGLVGAGEPHIDRLVLVSGDIPSYALIAREGSCYKVDRVRDERDLDPRPDFVDQGHRDRHMVICEGTLQGRQLNIGLCHCPASKKTTSGTPALAKQCSHKS